MKMNPGSDTVTDEEEAPVWTSSSVATIRERGRLHGNREVGTGGKGWLSIEVAGAAWVVG
jgi:hypothetical protein